MKVRKLSSIETFICDECRFSFYLLNSEEDRVFPNFCPNCGVEVQPCLYYHRTSNQLLCKKGV
jgi:hypothetical protein